MTDHHLYVYIVLGTEQQALVQMVQLEHEHFHLYRALCLLLQLEEEELLQLQRNLPNLTFLQLIQITRLIEGKFLIVGYLHNPPF